MYQFDKNEIDLNHYSAKQKDFQPGGKHYDKELMNIISLYNSLLRADPQSRILHIIKNIGREKKPYTIVWAGWSGLRENYLTHSMDRDELIIHLKKDIKDIFKIHLDDARTLFRRARSITEDIDILLEKLKEGEFLTEEEIKSFKDFKENFKF
jgi:hypothetical protein